MTAFWQDLRYAARTMARRPGFTLVAVLTLALGIGANTTVFLWIKAILLQPLPGVPASRDVVEVAGLHETRGRQNLSYQLYLDLRDRNSVLSGLAVHYMQGVGLTGEGEPERAWAELVSVNAFDVLGVRPLLGRFFLREEDHLPLGEPVAVISYRLWRRRFGGDQGAVGAVLTVNGQGYTVIGVAPEGFAGGFTGLAFDLWVPVTRQPHLVPGGAWIGPGGGRWLEGFGRLAPGVTPVQAQAQLSALSLASATLRGPQDSEVGTVTVRYLGDSTGGAESVLGPLLLALLALVGILFLVTCANVAGLIAVRSADRRREFAVRLSMGSSGRRLARLLVGEVLLLASLAGALASLAAVWGATLLPSMIPRLDMPVAFDLRPDPTVYLFTFGLSVLAGLLCALPSVQRATRVEIAQELRHGVNRISTTRRQRWERDLLVGAQIALSTALLFAAGLFLRSVAAARGSDPGFNPRGVLLASIDLFPAGVTEEEGLAIYRRLLDRLAALPGVEAASLSRRVPLSFGGSESTIIDVPGYAPPANN